MFPSLLSTIFKLVDIETAVTSTELLCINISENAHSLIKLKVLLGK